MKPSTLTVPINCGECRLPFQVTVPTTTGPANTGVLTVAIDLEAMRAAVRAHVRQHIEC